MAKVTKYFLISQFIILAASAINQYYTKPLTLILLLLINFLLWFSLWFCVNYIIVAQPAGKKWHFLRWLSLAYFSILAMEIGSLGASLLQFLVGKKYVPQEAQDLILLKPWSTDLINLIGILLAIPLVFRLARDLGFEKPKRVTVKIILFWAFLILLLRPR